MSKLLFLFLLLISSINSKAQSKKIIDQLYKETSAKVDTLVTPEKIYLHFNKSNFNTGDDVWFKIYLVDANTNKPSILSKIVYVDLINASNKIVDSKIIKIEKGFAEGDFKLATNLFPGEYTVRAYTNFMRNFDAAYFFRKNILINPSRLDPTIKKTSLPINTVKNQRSDDSLSLKPDIQFFPEGGYLVNNLISRVGFKALGIYGKGIQLSGIIVDEEGKKVTGFSTFKFGMGDFSFKPIQGKSYKAKIIYNNHEVSYELPIAKSKGLVMQVVEHQDNYRINLQSSLTERTESMEVIGRKNGSIICRASISVNIEKTIVNISKASLESGIVQFTVYNSKGIPICERLVFVEKEEVRQKVNIASSKTEYGKRDLVELEISMDWLKKKAPQANMSIAITDVTFEQIDSLDLDIKSHLLLNSELKGEIEHPGYYFYSHDSKRKRNLDLLMMCQGWRQFVWNEVLVCGEQSIKYPFEQGFSFNGKVKKYSNHNKSESAMVSVMIRNDEEFYMDVMLTNKNGSFEFGDYDITDSTSIIIQAQSPRLKKVISKKSIETLKTNYFIELDTFAPPNVIIKHHLEENIYKNDLNHYPIIPNPIKYSNSTIDELDDRIKLDEVELTAIGVNVKKYDTYIKNKQLYREPSQRVDFAELGKLTSGNILKNLDGRIAGLSTRYMMSDNNGRQVNGIVAYFNRTQTTTNPKLPLYLLNGIPVDAGAIMLIPMVDVLFVDALRGAKAAIYGSEGAHGVIAVFTKDGSEIKSLGNKNKTGIVNFTHPGYSPIRKFYEPLFKSKGMTHEKSDHRTTICWKPTILLNEQGKAKISFYSANVATTYRVELQGISYDGAPLVSEIFLDIE